MFSQIKERNILNKIFILLPKSCPGEGLGVAGGVKNFSGGFAMAPHRLRTLVLNIVRKNEIPFETTPCVCASYARAFIRME